MSADMRGGFQMEQSPHSSGDLKYSQTTNRGLHTSTTYRKLYTMCISMIERWWPPQTSGSARERISTISLQANSFSIKKVHAEQTEKIQKLETENKQKDSKLKKQERALSFVIPSSTLRIKLSQINSKICKGQETYIDPFCVGLYKCRDRFDWVAETGFIGCFLCIMKGEWDDKLEWPFRYKLEVTLVNQETGGLDFSVYVNSSDVINRDLQTCPSAFDKPVHNSTNSIGIPCFKAITSLYKSKYNRNDSIILLFKVGQMEI